MRRIGITLIPLVILSLLPMSSTLGSYPSRLKAWLESRQKDVIVDHQANKRPGYTLGQISTYGNRLIRVLTTYDSVNFYINTGLETDLKSQDFARGLEYQRVNAFIRFINDRYQLDVASGFKAEFIPVDIQDIPTLLAEGYADLAAANLTDIPERTGAPTTEPHTAPFDNDNLEGVIRFSWPIHSDIHEHIVTRKDTRLDIDGNGKIQLADLQKRSLPLRAIARRGSSHELSLTKLIQKGANIQILDMADLMRQHQLTSQPSTPELLDLMAKTDEFDLILADSSMRFLVERGFDGSRKGTKPLKIHTRFAAEASQGRSIGWATQTYASSEAIRKQLPQPTTPDQPRFADQSLNELVNLFIDPVRYYKETPDEHGRARAPKAAIKLARGHTRSQVAPAGIQEGYSLGNQFRDLYLKNITTFLDRQKKVSDLSFSGYDEMFYCATKHVFGDDDFNGLHTWAVMLVQSFVESKFNPNAVSQLAVQAYGNDLAEIPVGLGQMKPSTTKHLTKLYPHFFRSQFSDDEDQSIKQIRDKSFQPYFSIFSHALYVRHLRDTYFADYFRFCPNAMEDQELRFTLAGYNNGHAYVRRSHKKLLEEVLSETGLSEAEAYNSCFENSDVTANPFIWFGHVEDRLSQLRGDEPKKYVSDINRLYVWIFDRIQQLETRLKPACSNLKKYPRQI